MNFHRAEVQIWEQYTIKQKMIDEESDEKKKWEWYRGGRIYDRNSEAAGEANHFNNCL